MNEYYIAFMPYTANKSPFQIIDTGLNNTAIMEGGHKCTVRCDGLHIRITQKGGKMHSKNLMKKTFQIHSVHSNVVRRNIHHL